MKLPGRKEIREEVLRIYRNWPGGITRADFVNLTVWDVTNLVMNKLRQIGCMEWQWDADDVGRGKNHSRSLDGLTDFVEQCIEEHFAMSDMKPVLKSREFQILAPIDYQWKDNFDYGIGRCEHLKDCLFEALHFKFPDHNPMIELAKRSVYNEVPDSKKRNYCFVIAITVYDDPRPNDQIESLIRQAVRKHFEVISVPGWDEEILRLEKEKREREL